VIDRKLGESNEDRNVIFWQPCCRLRAPWLRLGDSCLSPGNIFEMI
jgi:hypothetical protein